MNQSTTKQSARFPRHRHEWRDLGARTVGGWRYRCALCQRRSRNPYYQLPQFRRAALRDQPSDLPAVTTRDDRQAMERRCMRRRAR